MENLKQQAKLLKKVRQQASQYFSVRLENWQINYLRRFFYRHGGLLLF